MLAIGLGSTVGIYSLFHSIVLQPLPYDQPEKLVTFRNLNHVKAIDQEGVSPADFRDYGERSTSFSKLGAVRPNFIAFTRDEGPPVQMITGLVTAELFDVFGVSPIMEHTFNADEFSYSAPRTVVLSEEAWQRYFGGQSDVLGTTITLDDQPHTVIGII